MLPRTPPRCAAPRAARLTWCALLGLLWLGPARAAPEGEDSAAAAPSASRASSAAAGGASGGPAKRPQPKAGFVVPEALKRQRSEAAPAGSEALFALAPPEVLAALGAWRPQPGAWVEYEVRRRGHAPVQVRLSVLQPALPEGRYWLEIAAASAGSVPVVARLLVHGQPTHPADVERTLVYVAGQAVLELPLEEADGSFEPRGEADRSIRVKARGEEQVKVRAGTFTAQRLEVSRAKERATLWRADGVPILGLVKAEDEGSQTELTGHGLTGARTLFPRGQDPDAALLQPGPPADAAQGNGSESRK